MKCSICNSNETVYYQRFSGLRFCKKCFINYITKKVRKTIGKDIIRQNTKIGIGLSGGKDSLVMAYLLKQYFEPIPNTKIIAIMVDEGIEGYRNVGIKYGINFCKKYGIEYKIVSFKNSINHTLTEIVELAKEKNIGANPCTFCGIIRRKILNSVAIDEGLDYLSIGHNLDDTVQSIMMNYIDGNIQKLIVFDRHINHPKFINRIKPLKYIPENEVLLFADIVGIKYHKEPCPYSSQSYRYEIGNLIDSLEDKYPGTKYSILSGYEKLKKYLPDYKEINFCKYCGDIASSEICGACNILIKLGIMDKIIK